MDELGRLLLLRDVVDAGGFSHAATKRGVSHSTVSKHISALEQQLGVKLLNRTSRAMSLTEAGELVVACSRRVGESVDQLREQLDELRGEVVGELRVNSMLHVGRHLVQPAIERFVREFPRTNVQLVLDDGPLSFSRDGFDVAVRVGLHAEGSLTASKLMENEVCVVAARAFVERWGLCEHPTRLIDFPTIGYQTPEFDITVWSYIEDGEVRTIEVHPTCRVNNGNALLEFVASGLGIGYVSAFAARDGLRSGELVRLFPDIELPAFDSIFVLQSSGGYPSLKLKAFKRHLQDIARDVRGGDGSIEINDA